MKEQIEKISKELEDNEQKSADVTTFIEKVKRYTEVTELTPEIVNEFIEKIVVYQKKKIDDRKVQKIDIYYNGIGIITIPLDEIEMEEAFQEYLNKNRIA